MALMSLKKYAKAMNRTLEEKTMKGVNDIVRMLTLGTADKQLPAVPKSAIADAAFRTRDAWNALKCMVYGMYVKMDANVAETYATVARRTSIPQETVP